jgi:hypothetical protein
MDQQEEPKMGRWPGPETEERKVSEPQSEQSLGLETEKSSEPEREGR